MKRAVPFSVALALPLMLLAACSQSNAPSEQMEQAATDLVEAVASEAPGAEATPGPYAPRDECSELSGAEPVLAALNAVVTMRDTDVMVALSATDIKLDFGGEDGAANLRKALDAEGGGLWHELETLVTLGCAANSQGGITIPYYFAQDLPIDGTQAMIVTGDDVALRGRPADTAPALATLSWQAVEHLADDPALKGEVGAEGWTHVRAPDGPDGKPVEGYIRDGSLRSVIDYRLLANSRNGRWRVTALLAGD